MAEFFLTRMGRTYYEAHVPAIVRALGALVEHAPALVTSLREIGDQLDTLPRGRRTNIEQKVVVRGLGGPDDPAPNVSFGADVHAAIEEGWMVVEADFASGIVLLDRVIDDGSSVVIKLDDGVELGMKV